MQKEQNDSGSPLELPHPYLPVSVRSDGAVFLPGGGKWPPRWTYGSPNNYGYRCVCIKGRQYSVHRLVVETFIQCPIPKGMHCDHKDRDKGNNRASNLRVVTPSINARNSSRSDRALARFGCHTYDDPKGYSHARNLAYRATEEGERTYRRTADPWLASNKKVLLADGSRKWVPMPLADTLLSLPVRQRFYSQRRPRK